MIIEEIQKFEIKIEVDFQRYDDFISIERFGENPENWYRLTNDYILEDTVHYDINEVIEYREYLQLLESRFNFDFDVDKLSFSDLIKNMYQDDFNQDQPFFIDFYRVEVISIEGYLEEE